MKKFMKKLISIVLTVSMMLFVVGTTSYAEEVMKNDNPLVIHLPNPKKVYPSDMKGEYLKNLKKLDTMYAYYDYGGNRDRFEITKTLEGTYTVDYWEVPFLPFVKEAKIEDRWKMNLTFNTGVKRTIDLNILRYQSIKEPIPLREIYAEGGYELKYDSKNLTVTVTSRK